MKISLLSLISLLLIASCGKMDKSTLEFDDGTQPEEETEPLPEETVSFQDLSQKVLVPRCIECHGNFESEEGLRFSLIPGDAERSALFQNVRSGFMPLDGPPLSEQEIEIVRNYIDQLSPASTLSSRH